MAEQLNASKNEHTLDIRSGIPILNSRYGLKIDEFDYLDIAINELRDIKNFGSTEYVTILTVDPEGWIDLPCNLDSIDAITTTRMGAKAFSNRVKYDMDSKKGTDDYFTAMEIMENLSFVPSYGLTSSLKGEGYIQYQLKGKRVFIGKDAANNKVSLAFTGIGVDPEGYPKITRKQANAIAVIAAVTILTKQAIKGNRNAAAMSELFRGDAARLKQAASIPEELSDNDINSILDIQTSFNRKSYKRPTKYSR